MFVSREIIIGFAHSGSNVEIGESPFSRPIASQHSVTIFRSSPLDGPQGSDPDGVALQLEIQLGARLDPQLMTDSDRENDLALVRNRHG
jgi:hypothetical protein